MKHSIFIIALLAFIFQSCKKNGVASDYDEKKWAPLSIEFDNIVGGQNLVLNATNYKNAANETYNIQLLQYFISNIKLGKSDGSVYTVPQDSSYFLIDESNAESRFAKLMVPEGDYTTLSFVIGIDSLRSTTDVSKRTGVLDPANSQNGMYWAWNSGYIFFKMEGTSPQAPAGSTGTHKFRFHIGGFGGYSNPTINNIKTVNLDLSARGIAQVRENRQANIHLFADINKVLSGSTTVSFANNANVTFVDYSINIANNYANMFVHDHTEN